MTYLAPIGTVYARSNLIGFRVPNTEPDLESAVKFWSLRQSSQFISKVMTQQALVHLLRYQNIYRWPEHELESRGVTCDTVP